MSTVAMPMNWSNQGPSLKLDVMAFVVALALHVPLYFMKFDSQKKSFDRQTSRLVAIDLIDPAIPAPAPAPPPPVAKDSNLMQRLRTLVQKEPPPPPPPPKRDVKAPEKLDTAPREIKLDPKLNIPEPAQNRLVGRAGFQTKADPKLIEDKKIALRTVGTGAAPLSERRLGTATDRESIKSDRGNFQVAQADTIRSIGSRDAGLADPTAPTIAIRTGAQGSTEKFSAAPVQREDRGRLGSVDTPGVGTDRRLGLRDSIIARDAAPSQIDTSRTGGALAGVRGGVTGGVEGGTVGAKQDAGRFQGGEIAGVPGGVAGGRSPVTAAAPKPAPPVASARPKRSMFVITGPLKDRKIVHQDLPSYPSWAIAQGIEAAVILQFTVDPDGAVKDNIVVRRTSGYPQLDQLAANSLRKWKFAPIAGSENREEVGQITFNFSLN